MELSIVRLVEEYGVMRRYAKVSPMGSDTKTVPVRTGGMTAYAVGESNENTSSNTGTATSPTYKPVELVARKWKAWCKISDELNWVPNETFATGIKKTVQWYLNNLDWCKNIEDSSYQRERLGLQSQNKNREV